MSTHAKGTFKVKNWEEKPYQEKDGTKLTRATVSQDFEGDIEGEGVAEYLMAHRPDKTASFVGLQSMDVRIGPRHGSFVLQVIGTFDGSVARGTWSVIAGMGTGDFVDLHGEGGFEAPMGPDGSYALDYDLEKASLA